MTKLMQAAEMDEMKLARVLMMLSELPYKMADITIRYKITENTAASTNANCKKNKLHQLWGEKYCHNYTIYNKGVVISFILPEHHLVHFESNFNLVCCK